VCVSAAQEATLNISWNSPGDDSPFDSGFLTGATLCGVEEFSALASKAGKPARSSSSSCSQLRQMFGFRGLLATILSPQHRQICFDIFPRRFPKREVLTRFVQPFNGNSFAQVTRDQKIP